MAGVVMLHSGIRPAVAGRYRSVVHRSTVSVVYRADVDCIR